MLKSPLQHLLAAAALAAMLTPALTAAATPASAASEHPSVKRPFNLPPSADLSYAIKVRQHGLTLGGEALIAWRAADGKYSIVGESRAGILGKVLDSRSEGEVDGFGLAPAQFYEKRFRKDPTTTTFKRDSKTIVFSESSESYPLKGGEQDRTSVPWQLIAVARGAQEKFAPGSEWSFFVAGRRDAERWSFKVINNETIHTPLGDVDTVHLVKAPPPDAQGQQVDIWLAPSLEWYPVRLRFVDNDGDTIEQTLEKISAK